MRFFSPVFLTAAASALASGLAGCSASVSSGADAADAEAGASVAIVTVERAGPLAWTGEGGRAEAVLRVVRARSGAVDANALHLVGAALDLPPAGSCASSAASQPAGRPVQLVDVGTVTVETGGFATALLPRRLPDVANLVSGVVYARAAEPEALPPRQRYEIRSSGNGHESPFFAAATAPLELSGLHIAGRDTRTLSAGGPIVLTPGDALEVGWDPGTADDVVYVDLVAGGATQRCAFVDALGRGILGALSLASSEEGTLVVHRLHREPILGRAGDGGEVRFDFSRAMPFVRR